MPRLVGRGAGKAVELPAYQVAQRVAGEQIQGQQNDVDQEDDGSEPNVKVALIPESFNCVLPQKDKEDDRSIEKIAVQVLQDEWKLCLAPILLPPGWLTHGAARRIGEKCTIVGFAVVIAGHAESQGEGKDQERRRPFPEMMVSINQRRIKGGKIGAPGIKVSFEGAQGGVNAKAA
jgi:hypothetical protein